MSYSTLRRRVLGMDRLQPVTRLLGRLASKEAVHEKPSLQITTFPAEPKNGSRPCRRNVHELSANEMRANDNKTLNHGSWDNRDTHVACTCASVALHRSSDILLCLFSSWQPQPSNKQSNFYKLSRIALLLLERRP